MSELEEFHREKDEFFRHHLQSPLTPAQKRKFTGLNYFPENPELRLRVPLNSGVAHDILEMDTSTGGKQRYRRAGSITFYVEGVEAVLSLYSSDDQDELFLPFRDATSGKESYGSGRYLEAALSQDGMVLVDFNYAYNPYCAYSERWNCPVPPPENWLAVPINAGEKAWH